MPIATMYQHLGKPKPHRQMSDYALHPECIVFHDAQTGDVI